MNAFQRIWIVFRKEIIDNLRDRRSVSSALLTPLFTPVFLIVMIMVVGRSVMSDMIENPLDLPVVGAEYAPGLVDYLRENNVNILPAPADPQGLVRQGDADVVLIIAPGYGDAVQEGRPAPLQLILDSTRQSSLPEIERARGLLYSYEQTLSSLRLLARGVDPSVLDVLSVQTTDISTPESRSLLFLNMLPFLLIMTIFTGGMYVIIDATAGERERGSLEPLLINPIPRRDFALGKLLASLPFALVALAMSLVLFWVGFNVIPMEEYVGMQMNVDMLALWKIFLLSLPMILLASAIQMVIASFTHSFKEANTYLPFVPLIAGLPGAFLAFLPVKMTSLVAWIPIFSQSLLINQIMRAELVSPQFVLYSTVGTLLLALVFIVLAVWLYRREQILFGSK